MKIYNLLFFSLFLLSCQNSKSLKELVSVKEVELPIKYSFKSNNDFLADSIYKNELIKNVANPLFLNLELGKKGKIYPVHKFDLNNEIFYTFIYDKEGIELFYDDLILTIKKGDQLEVIFSETLIPDEYGSLTEVSIYKDNLQVVKCNLEFSPEESYDEENTDYKPSAEHLTYEFSSKSGSLILLESRSTVCP